MPHTIYRRQHAARAALALIRTGRHRRQCRLESGGLPRQGFRLLMRTPRGTRLPHRAVPITLGDLLRSLLLPRLHYRIERCGIRRDPHEPAELARAYVTALVLVQSPP